MALLRDAGKVNYVPTLLDLRVSVAPCQATLVRASLTYRAVQRSCVMTVGYDATSVPPVP